jgi:hypothetical protein
MLTSKRRCPTARVASWSILHTMPQHGCPLPPTWQAARWRAGLYGQAAEHVAGWKEKKRARVRGARCVGTRDAPSPVRQSTPLCVSLAVGPLLARVSSRSSHLFTCVLQPAPTPHTGPRGADFTSNGGVAGDLHSHHTFSPNNTHQPAHTPPPWPTRADRRRASIGESPLRHPVNNTSKQASRHLRRSTTAAAAAAVTHLPAGPGVAFSPASHRHRPTASRRSRSAETARCNP